MALHKVRKGLRLPILGEPVREVDTARAPARVALLAADYIGMRPTMQVAVGDAVRRGQVLFEDKKTPGVVYTSPAAGRVAAVHRGDRRAFQSVAIELSRGEREGRSGEQVTFRSFTGRHPASLRAAEIKELLLESGLWTALRGRPFSRVANPETQPHSIFVTAIDTQPLAPPADLMAEGRAGDLERALVALSKLTDGPVFLCTEEGSAIQVPKVDRVRHERFVGPHPAGTVGYHIHRLDPVDRHKTVWHLGLQDALAIGTLFETGALEVTRLISLGGPPVRRPRLLKTRLGAATADLLRDEVEEGETRVISGSVLSGRVAQGEIDGYLGRYDQQISVLREDRSRHFLGWLAPGANLYSVIPTFVSKLMPGKKFALTTSTHGSKRAIVPIGLYERVMPFDLEPVFVLKSIVMQDIEQGERLGVLELDEEDVALCSFVCPGKTDYGPRLRALLATMEKEG